MENKSKYLIIDHEGNCIFKTNELTSDIEYNIIQGHYVVIDLETMEEINSNKNGLFRTKINEY